MNERADAGDDEQHHRGQRIDSKREVEDEVTRRDPGVQRLLDEALRRREARHAPDHRERDGKRCQHRQRREPARDRFRQAPSQRRVDDEAEEREQRDEGDHHHFNSVKASGLSDSRWRKRPMTIAKPTAASAAATVMTKNVMICPSTVPCERPNATNVRFTAFSMISIDSRIVMRLRRRKTPAAPIAKSSAETMR